MTTRERFKSVKCARYGFQGLGECSIIVPDGTDPTVYTAGISDPFVEPAVLLNPIFSHSFTINKRSQRAGIDIPRVLEDIKQQGYHLQWHIKPLCYIQYSQCMFCEKYLGVAELYSSYNPAFISVTSKICPECLKSDRYKDMLDSATRPDES